MKRKRVRIIIALLVSVMSVIFLGATVTYSKFYSDFEKGANDIKIADAVAVINVNSIYRTDVLNNRVPIEFDKRATSVTLNDIEPEDEIEYYFTITGIDGKRSNEVTMNVTLSITVRLETIASDGSGKQTSYFGGWTTYTDQDGIKDGAYLKIYHGSETDSARDILPSMDHNNEIDFTGNRLSIIKTTQSIVNKTGFVMAADDDKKEYPYHLVFTLPRQSTGAENYAGARVYFDIQAVAEQSKQV